jgi:mono/diheme cytochrome c family protein
MNCVSFGISSHRSNEAGTMMRRLMVAAISLMVTVRAGGQEMSYGQAEYLNSCAACHGSEGKGDGPLVEELLKRPSDLTLLAEQNGGEFPFWRVFAVIDGRYIVPGHGEREMPVWGRQFLEGDVPMFGPNAGEAATKQRILELAAYVESLQR